MNIKQLLTTEFLEKLRYKLSIGNARSIYLNCLPGRYKGRIELKELENILPNSAQEFLQLLFTSPNFTFEIKLPQKKLSTEEVSNNLVSILKARLDYLIAEDVVIKQNLGVHTLNFGYPIISYKKAKDDKVVYAPLLLWEVELKRNSREKNSYILTRSAEAGIRINEMFMLLLQEDAQVNIEKLDTSILEEGYISQEKFDAFITSINQQIFPQSEPVLLQQPFTLLQKDILPENGWINSGVFGHYRHLKTPIIREIQTLTETILSGEDLPESTSFTLENTVTSIDTDPSQQHIVEALTGQKNIIIQGPPGTGKSQTLTAIISTVVANGGKCLVVCEKDAAMNVIKENLHEIGINPAMILKITDPIYDRMGFAQSLSVGVDQSKKFGFYHDKKTLRTRLEKNMQYMQTVNESKKHLYQPYALGLSFRDMIGRLSAIQRTYKFKKALLIKFDAWPEVHIDTIKKLFLELEQQYKKVAPSIAVLADFSNEFITELNPLGYQKFQLQLDESKQALQDLINKYDNIRKNPQLQETKFNVSLIRKLHALVSPSQAQINTLIESFEKDLNAFKEKCNLLPLTSQLHLQSDATFNQVFLLLDEQNAYLEALSKVQSSEVFDYQDLIRRLADVDDHIREAYTCIVEDPDLATATHWDILMEKTLIEFYLNKKTHEYKFTSGESLNKEIENILLGKEEEKRMNTESINAEWLQDLHSLNKAPHWGTAKFLLTQKRQSPKQGPRKSLQQLFQSYSEEILTLCPVILTNPITANVLFSQKHNLFDVVLFDEASQLRLEDTITCMLLGKKIVISGDKHQMPPSDYFDNGITFDEDENEVIEEELVDANAESLLSFAYSLTNYFEDYMLECHYRSQHPDLIQFSNYAFYNGQLLPMPAKLSDAPIKFVQVDGIYMQKKRINIEECKQIIKLLKSSEVSQDDVIGIATLNLNQRDILREMITAEAEKDELFQVKLSHLEKKGFFIKNLENIQGDERDIIILSTTFGKNEAGKSDSRFGPLNNKAKGYKLLNVLITRAKKRLYVFNSIPTSDFGKYKEGLEKSADILSGASALYAYLSYAKAVSEGEDLIKKNILSDIQQGEVSLHTVHAYNSVLVDEIYERLKQEIETVYIVKNYQAGGFNVPIMILDKETNKPFVAIECDGYYTPQISNSAEWDVYRQKMFNRFNCTLLRIWSMDWWIDPYKQVEKVKNAIIAQ